MDFHRIGHRQGRYWTVTAMSGTAMMRFKYAATTMSAAALGMAAITPSHAQSVDSAYAFVDQVLGSGAATMTEADVPDAFWFTATSSQSKNCSTQATGTGKYGRLVVAINWTQVQEVKVDNSKTIIIGGTNAAHYSGSGSFDASGSGDRAQFPILTSETMAPRLAKAMKVIIAACAPSTGGF